jgi:hypothetical protein
MSLVNEYKQHLRSSLGLREEDPSCPPIPVNAGGGQMGLSGYGESLDEKTLHSVLELLQKEIAKREAVGETDSEGMEDPAAKSVEMPEAPVGGELVNTDPTLDMHEAEGVADDIYFEMLNGFKNNIANCEDVTRKGMYRKGYNYLYKTREKFIKEMTNCEEEVAQNPAVVK